VAFGRLERPSPSQPMSDINMTPLIDVMLVLLVIFLITAPLMGSSLKLDLPKSAAAQPNDSTPAIALAIDSQGRLFYGDDPLPQPTFVARLQAAGHGAPQTEVQLRADAHVPYGRVAEVLGWVQQAGFTRIGFVTDAQSAASAP
jgi:biopolymer transport protein ExbD/biopolymer transport protein TolR